MAKRHVRISLRFDWEPKVDARELVTRMLGVIETRCKVALRQGVRPDTQQARPLRKGATWGVSSGRLLSSIRSSPVVGGSEFAHGRVSVTSDRQEFAARHDVLTAEGKVGEALEDAIDGYLGERLE